mmetsp:Transcript_772/g.2998  ORF Transcript_772/g.2998 Transcript_772/m.2998 type:complete len:210 (+) Transcript_772:864-1493(+)
MTFAFAFLLVVVALVSEAGPLFLEGENIESDASRDAALVADASFSAFSFSAAFSFSDSVSATAAIKPWGSSAFAKAPRTAATSSPESKPRFGFWIDASSRAKRSRFAAKNANALATVSHANARVIKRAFFSSKRSSIETSSESIFVFFFGSVSVASANAARAASATSLTGKPSSNASASATSTAATRALRRADKWSAGSRCPPFTESVD